jgi:hypothetical protein
MLVALWQFDRESLVAGLLLFRLLYYLCPFVVALTVIGAREAWLNIHRRRVLPKAPSEPIISVAQPIRTEIEQDEEEVEKTDAR